MLTIDLYYRTSKCLTPVLSSSLSLSWPGSAGAHHRHLFLSIYHSSPLPYLHSLASLTRRNGINFNLKWLIDRIVSYCIDRWTDEKDPLRRVPGAVPSPDFHQYDGDGEGCRTGAGLGAERSWPAFVAGKFAVSGVRTYIVLATTYIIA